MIYIIFYFNLKYISFWLLNIILYINIYLFDIYNKYIFKIYLDNFF